MRFRCQECGALHEIPDEKLGRGKKVRCQRCKAITIVRPADALADEPDTQPGGKAAEPVPTGGWDEEDKATRVASIEEVLAGDERGAPEDAMEAETRIASVGDVQASEDDGIEAYDAVDWETQETVAAGYDEQNLPAHAVDGQEAMSRETMLAEAAQVDANLPTSEELRPPLAGPLPVQPVAAEVADEHTDTTARRAAPVPQPADPSLGDELFSDSVMAPSGVHGAPDEAGLAGGSPPAAERHTPVLPQRQAVALGGDAERGHRLLWFLALLIVAAVVGFGGHAYWPRIEGWLPDSLRGDEAEVETPDTTAEPPDAIEQPVPAVVEPSVEVPRFLLPGREQAGPDEQSTGLLALAEQAEEQGRPLEARVLAAAALSHQDREDARVLLTRLDDLPLPRLLWQSRPGARCVALARATTGERLACVTGSRAILWDLGSGEELQRLEVGNTELLSVALSPDGQRLAAGAGDAAVYLWELAGPVQARRLTGHRQAVHTVSFSPDGSKLASGSADRTVRLWDLAGDRSTRLSGHRKAVAAVAFGPQGQTLYSAAQDRSVRAWDVAAGKALRMLGEQADAVSALAVSSDGTVASGGVDGEIRLWPVQGESRSLGRHTDRVTALDFLADGTTLASASLDRTVRLWGPAGGGEAHKVLNHDAAVLSLVALASADRFVSASDDGSVLVWRAKAGDVQARLSGMVWPFRSVDISPDGRTVVAAGEDGTVRTWAADSGLENVFRPHAEARALRLARFSPSGRLLVVGDGRTAELWEYPEWKSLIRIEAPADAVAFTEDGRRMALGGDEPVTASIFDTLNGAELSRHEGPGRGISALAFGPRGSFLAAGSRDGTARIWYLGSDDSAIRRGSSRDAVTSLVFLGRTGEVAFGSEQGSIRRWVLAKAIELKPLKLRSGVRSLVASPDGRWLASGDADGHVILWDLASGESLMRLPGHLGPVTGVDFSEDGKRLASASEDGTVRLWELPAPGEGRGAAGKRLAGDVILRREFNASRLRLSGAELAIDPTLYVTRFSGAR